MTVFWLNWPAPALPLLPPETLQSVVLFFPFALPLPAEQTPFPPPGGMILPPPVEEQLGVPFGGWTFGPIGQETEQPPLIPLWAVKAEQLGAWTWVGVTEVAHFASSVEAVTVLSGNCKLVSSTPSTWLGLRIAGRLCGTALEAVHPIKVAVVFMRRQGTTCGGTCWLKRAERLPGVPRGLPLCRQARSHAREREAHDDQVQTELQANHVVLLMMQSPSITWGAARTTRPSPGNRQTYGDVHRTVVSG